MKEVYLYEKSLILSFARCLCSILSELTKGGANIMTMSKSKRIMQYIGTVLFTVNALYYCVLDLCMAINLVDTIIFNSPFKFWFDRYNDSIIGPFLFTALGLFVGLIMLIVVYWKNKKILPLLIVVPLYILSLLSGLGDHARLFGEFTLWNPIAIVCAIGLLAVIVYAIRLIGYGSKKEKVKQVSV